MFTIEGFKTLCVEWQDGVWEMYFFFYGLCNLTDYPARLQPLVFLFKHTTHIHISHVVENPGILGEAQEIIEF